MQAWLGLGANLSHPAMQIKEALRRLAGSKEIDVAETSSLYQTPPWGDEQQDDFVNAVVKIETGLVPLALLHATQAIEFEMGRQRTERRWGPRIIDIDLLLYANEVLQTTELILPHPNMHERAFVLLPLSELDSSLVIPGQGVVEELLLQLDCDGIFRLLDAGG